MVNHVIALPLWTFVAVGIILSIDVFTCEVSFPWNRTINSLLAGSIFASIYLVIDDIQRILTDDLDVNVFNINAEICRESTYLKSVTTVSAICFLCWTALDQYVGTPDDVGFWNRWGSLRFVRLASLSILFCLGFLTYLLIPLVYILVPAVVIIYNTWATIHPHPHPRPLNEKQNLYFIHLLTFIYALKWKL